MSITLLSLLGVIAAGTYIQTATGFGFGLIVMGVGGALGLLPIADLAFIASTLSLVNGVSGLYGGVWRHAMFRQMLVFLMAALPMVVVGLYWLNHLGQFGLNALQALLGVVMILVCVSSLLRPEPRATQSPAWHFGLSGAFAGVLSGLFSTAGPPISYLMYRQPVELVVIRSTLLSVFLVLASFRTSTAMFNGMVTEAMWTVSFIGAPLVLLGTYVSRRYLLSMVPAKAVRRLAMSMLSLSGLILLIKALY
ncbi:sulfite exporter TauE/SafE family protein [Marinomonas fungiae]|uniref:Probable membrane transporter protein n=1 Tax=Marinomonas fungiae TaxID=1137284 RepID=A0A0K6IQ57_9GAMM|nr:sulfite exporter TauE/SafE family protein [Marinomonas fungiae]CUB05452.1 Sulfite exporter TauE/SafE [Marinomonas fungiae]